MLFTKQLRDLSLIIARCKNNLTGMIGLPQNGSNWTTTTSNQCLELLTLQLLTLQFSIGCGCTLSIPMKYAGHIMLYVTKGAQGVFGHL
jgi:hypothetical protein